MMAVSWAFACHRADLTVVPGLRHLAARPLRSAAPHPRFSSSHFPHPESLSSVIPAFFPSHFSTPEERQSQLCICLDKLPVCPCQEWRWLAEEGRKQDSGGAHL